MSVAETHMVNEMLKTIMQGLSSCRNVEGMRRNWEALRREEMDFGERDEQTGQGISSDEDPMDNMVLRDVASMMKAKRILEQRNAHQSMHQAHCLHLSNLQNMMSASSSHASFPAIPSSSQQETKDAVNGICKSCPLSRQHSPSSGSCVNAGVCKRI